MQVSVESTTAIERRMTVGIPSEKVDAAVEQRLQQTARSVRINGFRPGKVPMSVVRKRFGDGVRHEVLGELMRDAYLEAVEQEKLRPVGYPRFEPKADASSTGLEFIAVFEVFPDVQVEGLGDLTLIRHQTEIQESDIDTMLDNLRKQAAKWVDSEEAAADGDRLVVDYRGTIDGEAFDGGTAENATIQIGAGRMIPGFEEGLVGLRAGDSKVLDVTFPEEYHAENLKGKAAQFAVTVKTVSKSQLPEVDESFFSLYGVEDATLESFRSELRKNMEREAMNAINAKIKQQIVDQLVGRVDFEVPTALVDNEINRMRQEAVERFGGGNRMDPRGLPAELFKDQARRRVQTGLIFAQIVKDAGIKVSEAQVRGKIEELASSYQDPQQFVEWFMSNPEQKAQIETAVMEDLVVAHVAGVARIEDQAVSYEQAVKPLARESASA